jgi:hypothetical protein
VTKRAPLFILNWYTTVDPGYTATRCVGKSGRICTLNNRLKLNFIESTSQTWTRDGNFSRPKPLLVSIYVARRNECTFSPINWSSLSLQKFLSKLIYLRCLSFFPLTSRPMAFDGRSGVVVWILAYYARGRGFDSRTVQTFVCMNMSVCIGTGCFYV